MTGLELIMGGLLLQTAAGGLCSTQKVPHISAQPQVQATQYNFNKSRADLQGFDIDTVSPYEPSHHAKVGGLMSGEIRVESRIRFMQEKYAARGAGCVHIDSIELVVRVDPTIYVANEYAQGTCQHNAIIEHEKKHVQLDVAIAHKYAASLKAEVLRQLRQTGHTVGPVPIEKIDSTQVQIQDRLQAIIKANSDAMTQERMVVQQALDSLEEYERVAAQCRGQRADGMTLPPHQDKPARTGRPRVSRGVNQ